jgi:Ion transport protein
MCKCRALNTFEKAAFVTRNALHGRRAPPFESTSFWAQRFYHNFFYRWFYILFACGNLLLAIWEPPSNASVTEDGYLALRIVDISFYAVVMFDLMIQYFYHGYHIWIRRGWVVAKISLTFLMLLNLAVNWAIPTVPYFMRALRPLFLIERLRNVRRVAGNIVSTIPKILNVLVLLALHVLFFSVLGFTLFAGISDSSCVTFRASNAEYCSTFNSLGCSSFFSTLENTAMQLFQLLTAANFPAIMIPAYNCNQWNALFFLFFIVIGCYLLINLTLAVTYSTFKTLMAEEVITKYSRMFEGFDLAFDSLIGYQQKLSSNESNDSNGLSRDNFIRFFACLRSEKEVDSECAGKLFDVFDSDKRGFIYKHEFRRLILNFGRLSFRRMVRNFGNIPSRLSSTLIKAPASVLASVSDSISDVSATAVQVDWGKSKNIVALDAEDDDDVDIEVYRQVTQAREKSNESEVINPFHSVGVVNDGSANLKPSKVVSYSNWSGNFQDYIIRAFSLYSSPDGYGVNATDAIESGYGNGFNGLRWFPKQIDPYSLRGRLLLFMQSLPVTFFFDLAVLMNTVAVLIQLSIENDEFESTQLPIVVSMRYVEYSLLLLYILEVGLKLILWGPIRYVKASTFHRVDLILVAISVIGASLELSNVVNDEVGNMLSFFRFLRLVRVLRVIPDFGLTVGAFGDIIGVLLQYVTVIGSVYYAFAIVGMIAFAGKLLASNPAVAASSYGVLDYYTLNFDSFAGALVCLLFLMVLNDWPVLMEGVSAAVGNASRLYFFLFWVITVIVALNVVVAFVIESFSTQKERREKLRILEDSAKSQNAIIGVATSGTSAGSMTAPSSYGIDDWRLLITNSKVDFSSWFISKKAHHFDIYEAIYREEVRSAFSYTFDSSSRH